MFTSASPFSSFLRASIFFTSPNTRVIVVSQLREQARVEKLQKFIVSWSLLSRRALIESPRKISDFMDRRRILSDVPELQCVERSPLIDPKKLRSCRGLSRSASVSDSGTIHKRASSTIKSNSLKPISELAQQQPLNSKYYALNRSQSAPHYLRSPHYTTPGAQHLRSPQYRVNPVVKFDDRALPPQRMNYGIAGYNTSRPRPHSFSSIPETAIATTRPRSVTTIPESPRPKPRPRSFSSVPESTSRPRSLISRSAQTPRPAAVRAIVWRSLTRRFRDKMGRIRVRDTCSKLLSRFRG